jgi:hypothetical protein
MDQLDPRLIEIEILSEADRAFVHGGASYQYTKANPSGPRDRQRDEALLGLMFERAIIASTALRARPSHSVHPDTRPPNPTYAIDAAALQAVEDEPFSLIVIDVDGLSKINAELGHHGADQVLAGIFATLATLPSHTTPTNWAVTKLVRSCPASAWTRRRSSARRSAPSSPGVRGEPSRSRRSRRSVSASARARARRWPHGSVEAGHPRGRARRPPER